MSKAKKNKELANIPWCDEVEKEFAEKDKQTRWPQVTERISCAVDILSFLQQNKNLPEKFRWRAKKVQKELEQLMDRAWSKY